MNPAQTPPVFLPGWCLGRGPVQASAEACGARILDLPGYNGTPCVETFDEAVDAIAAVETGRRGMHQDVPVENVVILDAVEE